MQSYHPPPRTGLTHLSTMPNYQLSHLDQLEAEAIFILRETAAQFQNPALLFSGGKDSIVMAWLARKAFWPARMPFPLVHIDTGHNFEETMTYRDEFVELIRANLVVGSVQESIDTGRVVEEKGPNASRNKLQTVTLLDTIEKHQYDACLGGGRRDEDKARAKERFFSHRREIFERNGQLLAVTEFLKPQDHETVETRAVRFRTIGDATCTGAVESPASDLDEVIAEVAAARQTERGTRADDKRSETAMEDRKKEGYF